MFKKRRRQKNRLEYRNGKFFENGRWLPKKDYIYWTDCMEGPKIISRVTGQLYRFRNYDGESIQY